jgi:hypothetical protein
MRRRSSALTSLSFVRNLLRIVCRNTVNFFARVFAQLCVKPRKSKVSGLPPPRLPPPGDLFGLPGDPLDHGKMRRWLCALHAPAPAPEQERGIGRRLLSSVMAEAHAGGVSAVRESRLPDSLRDQGVCGGGNEPGLKSADDPAAQ